MNIQDIRRTNLQRWLETNPVPVKEKSYISQLLGGASFGERSARRLERDYKMGENYLDLAEGGQRPVLSLVPTAEQPATEYFEGSDEFIELLALYQQSTSKGRKLILKFARSAGKSGASRWAKTSDKA
jgi:hypothetical protein